MQHLLFITNCICMRHMNDRLSNLEKHKPLKEVCACKNLLITLSFKLVKFNFVELYLLF